MSFKTIKHNIKAEIMEKKSRFIANIFYVETTSQAEEYIKEIKKEHYNAKHNCSAYIVMQNRRNYKKI